MITNQKDRSRYKVAGLAGAVQWESSASGFSQCKQAAKRGSNDFRTQIGESDAFAALPVAANRVTGPTRQTGTIVKVYVLRHLWPGINDRSHLGDIQRCGNRAVRCGLGRRYRRLWVSI